MNYVCSECGHEQDSMDRPCDNCNSVRVITIKFAQEHFGDNWRDCFKQKET